MKEILNWQFVFRAIIIAAGLEMFVSPLPKLHIPLSSGALKADNSSIPKKLRDNALHIISFAALALILVWVKLSRLRFVYDIAVNCLIFIAYLVLIKKIVLLDSVYLSAVLYLCQDFCVVIFMAWFEYGEGCSDAVLNTLPPLLFALKFLGLCLLSRRLVFIDEKAHLKIKDLLLLLLAFLPYLFIRSGSLLYALDVPPSENTERLSTEITLLLVIGSTFGTMVGNRNAVLMQLERGKRQKLEMELKSRQEQFSIRRETIAEVNRKYHDIVKYARMIEQVKENGKEPVEPDGSLFSELPVGILQETGSTIVDMILWERSELCRRENLRLIYSVDECRLDFINDFDMNTILGNALDNAIEAALPLKSPDKRDIRLKIVHVNKLLFISVSNCFSGELREEGQRLLTTKEDSDEHGFGLENIMRAAQRYGGTATRTVSGDTFTLTVMLPLPD